MSQVLKNVLYLGKQHMVQIGNYPVISVLDDKLLFPQFLHFRMQKELLAWYIQQAREVITRQIELNAAQMKANYTSITFSDTKSRWGACSHENALQFNWRLIMAPLLVLNYVVVHELAHTQEKNHSMHFWHRVSVMNPSYRQQRKWLKQYGHTLIVPTS